MQSFFILGTRVALLFACLLVVSYAQDCKVGGKRCADTAQCCGGCCIDGFCIDTTRLCMYSRDVCEDHSCIGDETCIAYSPPECRGCEPVPVCTMLK